MKILIIDLDNVGDVVMASFLPRAINELYPDSYLGVLIKEYSQDILRYNPFVNELIIFNPPWLGDMLDKRFSWRATAALIKKLKLSRYDLAIIVNSDWRKVLLAKLAGIPVRVGADKKKAGLLLTKPVTYWNDPERHTIIDNLDLLKALGYTSEKVQLEIFINPDAEQWAADFCKQNNISAQARIIGIHPGAGHPARIWPAAGYIGLINELIKEKNTTIFLFGAKNDLQAREIAAAVKSDRLINIQDISVLQMAALLKKCSWVIAQDSWPMHLAAAVGTKVMAIFGPSNPKKFGPYGAGHTVVRKEMPCSPCGSDPVCASLECIKTITVDDVLAQAKGLL